MSVTYGMTVRWTESDGSSTAYTVEGFASPREAKDVAFREAARLGWTAPRWWQFWRWDDTRPPG